MKVGTVIQERSQASSSKKVFVMAAHVNTKHEPQQQESLAAAGLPLCV